MTPVRSDSVDEVVADFYGWRWSEMKHKAVFVPFGIVSAISLGIAAIAM